MGQAYSRVNLWLHTKVLPLVLEGSKVCPSSVPRSGDAGKKVNCFVVQLFQNNQPFMLVRGYDSERLSGLVWQENQYQIEHKLSIEEALKHTLLITHFYGLAEIRYEGVWDFARNYFIGLPYFKVFLQNIFHKTSVAIYRQLPLSRIKKISLLKYLIKRHLELEDGASEGFTKWHIMEELHSIKWMYHPRGESQKRLVDLHLDSLVQSGELSKDGIQFKIAPKALATLSRYEEEERRHKDSVNIQILIVLLTTVTFFNSIGWI